MFQSLVVCSLRVIGMHLYICHCKSLAQTYGKSGGCALKEYTGRSWWHSISSCDHLPRGEIIDAKAQFHRRLSLHVLSWWRTFQNCHWTWVYNRIVLTVEMNWLWFMFWGILHFVFRLEMMKVASLICDSKGSVDVQSFFSDIYSNSSVLRMIKELAPAFHDTIIDCKLFIETRNCDQLFYPVITAEGLCYTFNSLNVSDIVTEEWVRDNWVVTFRSYLNNVLTKSFTTNRYDVDLFSQTLGNASNWNFENGYSYRADGIDYPVRVFGTGVQGCLRVLLKTLNQDIDHLCGGAIQGFKVTFHPPYELPPIWNKFYHVSPGQSAVFTIDPNVVETSPDIRKYSPKVRKCYYNSERQLRFFKYYSLRNCQLECISNYTLEFCGCVTFFMWSEQESRWILSAFWSDWYFTMIFQEQKTHQFVDHPNLNALIKPPLATTNLVITINVAVFHHATSSLMMRIYLKLILILSVSTLMQKHRPIIALKSNVSNSHWIHFISH